THPEAFVRFSKSVIDPPPSFDAANCSYRTKRDNAAAPPPSCTEYSASHAGGCPPAGIYKRRIGSRWLWPREATDRYAPWDGTPFRWRWRSRVKGIRTSYRSSLWIN